ncbi:DUF1127 domain-containing protein [Vibrio sonorensis]|uniref:DUF1127 domain-containing protein n=1 Tax=Vibrio sonorensis TaxID=1004316 RepID=UPI0008D95C69|nr:DUF1127 domain-containing protein [Vibrio sonorensis]
MQLSIQYRFKIEMVSPKRLLKKFYLLLMLWRRNYRTRRQLADLPEHLYQDIGVSTPQVNREVKRCFWD